MGIVLKNVVRVVLFAIDTTEPERSEPYGKCFHFLAKAYH